MTWRVERYKRQFARLLQRPLLESTADEIDLELDGLAPRLTDYERRHIRSWQADMCRWQECRA